VALASLSKSATPRRVKVNAGSDHVAVPPAIWAIVAKLCAKDRADRYASAESLLVELNRLLRDFPQSQGGPA